MTRRAVTETAPAVDYVRADLSAFVARVLAADLVPGEPGYGVGVLDTWRGRQELVVLARACAALGLDETAHRLLASARIAATESSELDLVSDVAETIARDQYRDALVQLKAGEQRERIRSRLAAVAKNLPKTEVASLAGEYASILSEMIREDARHDRRDVDLEKLTGQALIDELVYQLREQIGRQFMQPGAVYFIEDGIFWAVDPRKPDPQDAAHRLLRIGHPAVPALIGALQSRTLTRTYYLRLTPRTIEPVAECARQILEAMAGQQFRARTKSGADDWKAIRAQVLTWWRAQR